MILLLPPSEGKRDAPSGGAVLDVNALPFPELAAARERLIRTLIKASSSAPKTALARLGLSANQVDELTRNQQLLTAPTAAASQIYSGVLFTALGLESMTKAQQQRANEHVAIASAAFGFVRPDSPIPAYRCSGGSTLPRLGRVSSYWRKQIPPDLFGDEPVLDLRSGTYVAFMPLSTASPDSGSVKVWQRGPSGAKTAVTHFSKHTKGEVAGCLLRQRKLPSTVRECADCLRDHGFHADLQVDGRIARLDVTIDV